MAKDPAILLYTADQVAMMADLTMEERGQLITLLCLQHQNGELTKKMISIACPAGVSSDVMAKFVTLENGNYINLDWKEKSDQRANYAESRRKNRQNKNQNNNINKSYDKDMINQNNSIENTYVQHMVNENENENVIVNENKGVQGEILKSNDPCQILDIKIETESGADFYNLQIISKNHGILPSQIPEVWSAFRNKIRSGDQVYDKKQIWPRYMTFCSWYKKLSFKNNESKREQLKNSLS